MSSEPRRPATVAIETNDAGDELVAAEARSGAVCAVVCIPSDATDADIAAVRDDIHAELDWLAGGQDA